MCLSDNTVEGVDPMGRGRQKAKQTKVARKLKYFSPETDYNQLERELAAQRGEAVPTPWDESEFNTSTDDWDYPKH